MRIAGKIVPLALVLLGILGTREASADVTIGVLTPLTGKAGAYGVQQKAAMDIFLDHYGDLGKAGKLKLVYYDTAGSIVQAISLMQKLAEGGNAVAIVGPLFSGESEAVFPLAARDKIVVISPTAAKPGLSHAGRPWTFTMAGASVTSDRAAVDHWLKDDPKIHSAVILYDSKDAVSSSEATGVFPSVLKANGIKILDSISFQTGDIDFSAQVTRAKGLAPDGVVVAALYNEASHLMREMRSQGMQQPVAAGIGILDPRFIQLAGPSAEGVVVGTDYFSGIKSAANEMFVVEVDKQVHAPPSNAAALIYDTLYLVRNCIIKQNVMGDDVAADRRKIQQCVSTTKDEKTPLLLGATSFNADGESIRKPNVLIVKGGDFVLAP